MERWEGGVGGGMVWMEGEMAEVGENAGGGKSGQHRRLAVLGGEREKGEEVDSEEDADLVTGELVPGATAHAAG